MESFLPYNSCVRQFRLNCNIYHFCWFWFKMWKENKTLALKLGLKMSRKTSKKMLSFKFICQNNIRSRKFRLIGLIRWTIYKFFFQINTALLWIWTEIIDRILFAQILKNGYNSENITNRVNITNNWHSPTKHTDMCLEFLMFICSGFSWLLLISLA